MKHPATMVSIALCGACAITVSIALFISTGLFVSNPAGS